MKRFDDAMAAMAASLADGGDVEQSLRRITSAAIETVPGADLASISVRHDCGSMETVAATDPLACAADELQYELKEGPCYDAITAEAATRSSDLANDPKWPQFGPKAAALGLASQRGIRLQDRQGTVTGLNLYSYRKAAFDDDFGLTSLFASHATVALGYAAHLRTLAGALGTRETIGKAIGIVMERYGLNDERAFEFLIRMSQNSNTKLKDLAKALVDRDFELRLAGALRPPPSSSGIG
jgi:hypothetical protein